MTIRETVRKMTDGQRGDIVATMAGAIPPDLTFEEAQAIIGAKGPFVGELREVFAKRRLNVVPADDVWFSLEIDDVDPMSVVIRAGCNADDWEYFGLKFPGKQTLWAKLVCLGYVRNLKEAREKADKLGLRLVEGQAREPFKVKFPKPDGKGLVVFGGSEWQNPLGNASVTYLIGFRGGWRSSFRLSVFGFLGDVRWLVVGK